MKSLKSVSIVDHAYGLVFHDEADQNADVVGSRVYTRTRKRSRGMDSDENKQPSGGKVPPEQWVWEVPSDWVDAMGGNQGFHELMAQIAAKKAKDRERRQSKDG